MKHAELKAYFESLSAHADIDTALYAPIDEFLDRIDSTGDHKPGYPLLYVPTADRRDDENSAEFQYDTISIIISIYAPYGKGEGFATMDATLGNLEPIITDVIGKIRYDLDFEEDGNFPIKNFFKVRGRGPNTSAPLTSARLIGWVYEFEFQAHSINQHRPEKWL